MAEFTQQANTLMETNLRQATATFDAQGILSEMNLERTADEKNRGGEIVKGSLVIQTGKYNYVTVNVYIASKKRDGGENPAFPSILTVMDTFHSIVDVGAANATKLKTSGGTLRPSTYIDSQGNVRTNIRYNCSFFSSIKSNETYEPDAEFGVEMYISSLRPEVYARGENQGEETGRYIVDGWVPTYNGIEPITLIAPAENGIADAMTTIYEVGQTAKFYGHIVNSRVEQKKEIPVAIGKPRFETTYRTVNELVIDGASAPYPDEPMGGNPAGYNKETIQVAINDREAKLENQKKEAAAKNAAKSSGIPAGFMNVPATDDLPF